MPGYISSLRYYGYAVDYEEIQSLFQPSEQSSVYPASSSNVSNVSSFAVSGTSTPTPLSRPVNSETLFNKLKQIQDEEPKQEEPIIQEEESLSVKESTENPLTSQQQEPETTILEEVEKAPPITQTLQAEEQVRPADQYTTETLVEVKDPSQAGAGAGSTPNNDRQGLEEFTTKIKALQFNRDLIQVLQKYKIPIPKEKNRDGYEKALIKGFKDGLITP
jgi:hypothetical protein